MSEVREAFRPLTVSDAPPVSGDASQGLSSDLARERTLLEEQRATLEAERIAFETEKEIWQQRLKLDRAQLEKKSAASRKEFASLGDRQERREERLGRQESRVAKEQRTLRVQRRVVRVEIERLKELRGQLDADHYARKNQFEQARREAEARHASLGAKEMALERREKELDRRQRALELERDVRHRELQAIADGVRGKRSELDDLSERCRLLQSTILMQERELASGGKKLSTRDDANETFAHPSTLKFLGTALPAESSAPGQLSIEEFHRLAELVELVEQRAADIEDLYAGLADAERRLDEERRNHRRLLAWIHERKSEVARAQDQQRNVECERASLRQQWLELEARKVRLRREGNEERRMLEERELTLSNEQERMRRSQESLSRTFIERERALQRERDELTREREEMNRRRGQLLLLEHAVVNGQQDVHAERLLLLQQRMILADNFTRLEAKQGQSGRCRRQLATLRRRFERERQRALDAANRTRLQLGIRLEQIERHEQLLRNELRAAQANAKRISTPTISPDGGPDVLRMEGEPSHWIRERGHYRATIARMRDEIEHLAGLFVQTPDQDHREQSTRRSA